MFLCFIFVVLKVCWLFSNFNIVTFSLLSLPLPAKIRRNQHLSANHMCASQRYSCFSFSYVYFPSDLFERGHYTLSLIMRAAILFSALLAIASSMSSGCPPEEDVSPCMCIVDDLDVDLTLTCTEEGTTPEVLARVLRAIPPENTLAIELAWLTLGRLPSRFFENVKVKRLEIWNSNLDGLTREGEDGKPLAGLEDTLEELIISSSFTDASFKLSFGHLKRLQLLQLSYNSIPVLGDEWFKNGPPSLSKLILSSNGIVKIGERAFEDLTGLEYLYMDGNSFGPISRSMLPNPANKLAKLWIDNNTLSDLPEDMFSGMPSLTWVSLRNNGLRKMPRETFEPVWQQLETLDMRGNSLHCDSHLQWMFQVKTTAKVSGKCFSPPEKEGIELEDLLKGQL